MLNKLAHVFDQIAVIVRLPVAPLQFRLSLNPENVEKIYKYYTKAHPRYKIFQHKSLGAALVDLTRFRNRDEYMQEFKGRNSTGGLAKKARAKGYTVVEIDRNDFIDDIHEINTSIEVRQGRPMDISYQVKTTTYRSETNYKYYGVLNAAGKLVAYGELGFYGNFAAFNRVIGLRNNDGIMHLMVSEIICQLIEAGVYQYLMYDTYFGASPGLKNFKTMLGFQPYRAKYSIQ
jgi:hypothetical protein